MKGIPYMGSKRKIAAELILYMANANKQKAVFVDLFGGGGSVSFAALESGFFSEVYYNELNAAIVALLRKIQADGVTKDFYQWISRDRFFELIEGDDWLAGLAQTCWSFGNNQRDYLYGREIEAEKKRVHDLVMDVAKMEAINKNRLDVLAAERHIRDLENVERVQSLDSIARLQSLIIPEKLTITNSDYREFDLSKLDPKNTIIYCDIPYKGTREYRAGGFDHDIFFEWCNSSPFKIYVSSYEAPLNIVFQRAHKSILSASNNDKDVIENLYCNQQETNNGLLL